MQHLANDVLTTRDQNNFNLLRLLAALGVIITHSYALLGFPERDLLAQVTNGLLSFSRLGVYVFFVISGFLVTNSLWHSRSVLSFFWKRILRIFPALIVLLFITVFILGPTVTTSPLKAYFTQPRTYHYLLGGISLYDTQYELPGVFKNNPRAGINGSLWTLPYEWTCYLILAAGLWFVKKRRALLVATLIMLSLGLRTLIGHYQAGQVIDFLHLDSRQLLLFTSLFLLGALGLELRHRLKFGLFGSLLLTLGLVVLSFYNKKLSFYWMLLTIPYLTLWLAKIPLPQKIRRWFTNTDFSYGVYIYAFPVGQIVVHYFHKSLSIFSLAILTIVCTLPLAVLSWYLIEKKFLRLKTVGVNTTNSPDDK